MAWCEKTTVVRACSATKALPGPSADHVLRGHGWRTEEAAGKWLETLSIAEGRMPAGELYRGRAFRIAGEAATLIGARTLTASCGLGLIADDAVVPGYDCTISQGPGPRRHVESFDAESWWAALRADGRSRGCRIEDAERILIAVPMSYLDMISTEILAWSRWASIEIFNDLPKGHGLSGFAVPRPENLSGFRDGPKMDEGARRLLHRCHTERGDG